MVKSYKDYIEYLKIEYPNIDEKVLDRVLEKGLKNMQHVIASDLDVRIGNHVPTRTYKMTITRQMKNWDLLMQRANDKYYQLLRRRDKHEH